MLKTAFAALYLISVPGASAWAQAARAGVVAAVPFSVSIAGAASPLASARAGSFLPAPLVLSVPAPAVAAALAAPAPLAASAAAPADAEKAGGAAVRASAPAAAAEKLALHTAVAARANRSLHDTAAALGGSVDFASVSGPAAGGFLGRAQANPIRRGGEDKAAVDAAPVGARRRGDGRRGRWIQLFDAAGALVIVFTIATAFGALSHGWTSLLQQWENSIQATMHEDDGGLER